MRRDHAQHEGLRMPAWMRRWIHGVGLLSAATGVLWLLFHHFMTVAGEFGPTAHPLEHTWLVLHGAAAFLAAWVLGLIWMGHVRRGLAIGRKLASGLGLVIAVAFLMLSGWGLYYLGDEDWRERIATLHWLVGLGAVLLLLVHAFAGRARPDGAR